MAVNNRTTEAEGSNVDAFKVYNSAIYKLNQASALCHAIGAASNSGALPDDTIDMSLLAVSDLLAAVQGDVTQMFEATRVKATGEQSVVSAA